MDEKKNPAEQLCEFIEGISDREYEMILLFIQLKSNYLDWDRGLKPLYPPLSQRLWR